MEAWRSLRLFFATLAVKSFLANAETQFPEEIPRASGKEVRTAPDQSGGLWTYILCSRGPARASALALADFAIGPGLVCADVHHRIDVSKTAKA